MPVDWKDIKTDELLNYSDANTGQLNRYDRIMRQREIEALASVRAGLFDVKKAVHRAGDQLDERIQSFETAITAATEKQDTFQKVTIGLTIVIALATVAYTWVTWQSVEAQREANEIQRVQIESESK